MTGSSTAASASWVSESWRDYAGVPVWNGLTDEFHPTQMLADLHDHGRAFRDKPLSQITCCYLGDTRTNMGH